MNRIHYVLLICGLVTLSSGCKKNAENLKAKEYPSDLENVDDGFQAKLASINADYQPKQVITIAGKAGVADMRMAKEIKPYLNLHGV